MQSLKCLKNKFEVLDFYNEPYQNNKKDNEGKNIKSFFVGNCNLIDLLIEFEQLEVGFITEKTMIILIKKIQSYIES